MHVLFGRGTEALQTVMFAKEQRLPVLKKYPGGGGRKRHLSAFTRGADHDKTLQIQKVRFLVSKALCSFQQFHGIIRKSVHASLGAKEDALIAQKFHKEGGARWLLKMHLLAASGAEGLAFWFGLKALFCRLERVVMLTLTAFKLLFRPLLLALFAVLLFLA